MSFPCSLPNPPLRPYSHTASLANSPLPTSCNSLFTECHFLKPEARSPLVLIWGAKTGNSGKLLPLPLWTATGAADGGQGLFRAPLMHCSWKATAHFHAAGTIPESSTDRQFNKGISQQGKRRGWETLTSFSDLTSISKLSQITQG